MKKTRPLKRYFIWGFIFIFLFLFSFVVSLFLQIDSPLYQVTESYNSQVVSTNDPIHKGESIRGEIKSNFSNLGIVAIKFNTHNKVNNDVLIFRLKEKGNPEWYYENTYKTDQFQNNQFFTFGFPLIENSKGKVYEFQLVSKNGKEGNDVAMSTEEPVITTMYQYSSQILLKSGLGSWRFFLVKYLNAFNSIKNIIIIISPFLIFAVLRLVAIKNTFRLVSLLLLIATFVYIFLLGRILPGNEVDSWGIILTILAAWIIFFLRYGIDSKMWFISASCLIVFSSLILILFQRTDIANRSATVAYLFICIGTIQGIFNELRPRSKELKGWLLFEKIFGVKVSKFIKKRVLYLKI